jgi:hypothetical protein
LLLEVWSHLCKTVNKKKKKDPSSPTVFFEKFNDSKSSWCSALLCSVPTGASVS